MARRLAEFLPLTLLRQAAVRIGEVDTFLMARGINGPVDIKIYNGTYNEANMVLNTVPGASATNTIKFSSFSNDSLQVSSGLPHLMVDK